MESHMFKKLTIASRRARAAGAVAKATHCVQAGEAGREGEFTLGAPYV